MLLLAKNMYGAWVEASDGKVGKLCYFLFDDHDWTTRHLVLDGGTWLNRRRITLPPDLVREKDWPDHRLLITGLTRQQVVDSPGAETHLPVPENALEEITIMDWEIYWTDVLNHPWQMPGDPHLQNTQELTGYHIHATDGPIGHVGDFVLDDQTWRGRYLAVDTRNWWAGKHVLVASSQVADIDRRNRAVGLALSRQSIEHCPQYRDTVPLSEPQEVGMGGLPPDES